MKNCLQCGKEFTPDNAKGVYCSGACKVKASRERAKSKQPGEQEPEKEPDKEIPVDTPIRNGELCNIEFSKFLREFDKQGNLTDLRKRAENSTIMNLRQKEAILARCHYAMIGEYGNTKTAEHLKHSGLLTSKP